MNTSPDMYDLSWTQDGNRYHSAFPAWTHELAYSKATRTLYQRKEAHQPQLIHRDSGHVLIARDEVPF